MLLEFRMKNYKSFVDSTSFSMIPAPKQKGLDYSILSVDVGKHSYKGLCSAVIYGPNASGKTNLIGAIEVFKAIVLRGNIRNGNSSSANNAAAFLELIPNCYSDVAPTEFFIKYVDDGLLVEYSVNINLGPFLERDYHRQILEEILVINRDLVFHRDMNGLIVNLPSSIKRFVNKSINRKTPKMLQLAVDSLSDDELFLNNGFKNIYAQELVTKIIDWFNKKLIVVYRADDFRLWLHANQKSEEIFIEKMLTDVAKEFGVTSNALAYKKVGDKDKEDVVLCSVINDKLIVADVFESYGTIRFIHEFPLIVYVLLNGGTLVLDEFDASIHPMALMNIINIFHNDEINVNHAQLVFNTHNPIFLNSSLLRRDEIKFVERDSGSGNSIHYSLSDFRTADGIRKGEDYMNNYFVNRYGAINDVDFSPILERIILDNGGSGDE